MTSLVVTNRADVTTDLLLRAARARRIDLVRLNCDDFDRARPTFSLGGGASAFSLVVKGRRLAAADVTSACLRRPCLPGSAMSAGVEAAYRQSEWRAMLASFYSSLHGKWLNEPSAMELAEDKVAQLRLAFELGLRVPRTLVSNDPEAVGRFCAEVQSVVKPLRSGALESGNVFTNRMSPVAPGDEDSIRAAPLIVQEEVPKAADVRVTVVGRKVFAARIDSQGDSKSEVDWRMGDVATMGHEPLVLPWDVEVRCVAVVRRLGLRFSAIDLVLDRQGEYHFLEVNPNGQWGWVETRTGQPIADAILDVLEDIGRA